MWEERVETDKTGAKSDVLRQHAMNRYSGSRPMCPPRALADCVPVDLQRNPTTNPPSSFIHLQQSSCDISSFTKTAFPGMLYLH